MVIKIREADIFSIGSSVNGGHISISIDINDIEETEKRIKIAKQLHYVHVQAPMDAKKMNAKKKEY